MTMTILITINHNNGDGTGNYGGMEKGALTIVVVGAHGRAGVVWGGEYFGL